MKISHFELRDRKILALLLTGSMVLTTGVGYSNSSKIDPALVPEKLVIEEEMPIKNKKR